MITNLSKSVSKQFKSGYSRLAVKQVKDMEIETIGTIIKSSMKHVPWKKVSKIKTEILCYSRTILQDNQSLMILTPKDMHESRLKAWWSKIADYAAVLFSSKDSFLEVVKLLWQHFLWMSVNAFVFTQEKDQIRRYK